MADQSIASCSSCGYSLRGIASDHCPECGVAVERKLVFLGREPFEAAERALRAAGIAFRSFDSDRGLGNIIGTDMGMMDRKHILIDRARFDEAMEVFERHDIHFPLPLVDRHEPQCPNCSGRLDTKREPPCPTCHAEFIWVDVGDVEFDRDDLTCEACGYLLRGGTGNRCTECGATIPVTWREVMDIHPTAAHSRQARRDSANAWVASNRRLMVVLLSCLALAGMWQIFGLAESGFVIPSTALSVTGVAMFMAVVVAVVMRRLRK